MIKKNQTPYCFKEKKNSNYLNLLNLNQTISGNVQKSI
jgi:hypothetical protein